MKEKCKYIKASGYDVLCSKNSVVLGDIIGYSGQQCEKCEFYQSIEAKQETRQTVFRQTKEEFEQLKNDAYEHKMNISDYLRYLVAKERKEMEKNGLDRKRFIENDADKP